MRGLEARAADVRRLLDAGKRVAADASMIEPLVRSTGLSREGVELGLSRHLETSATEEEIAALVRAAGDAPSVHVILSASVFVAPLRAAALALAASERVTIKPSRREPHFTRALLAALDDPRLTLSAALHGDLGEGELHVYGRDDTIAAVRAAARPGVRVRGHGNGLGVALVTGEHASAASALAWDVVVFDQRGCLSPRVAFVTGDTARFARELRDALEALAARVPRGGLEQSEAADLVLWASTASYAGTLLQGDSCAVAVMEQLAIPPTGRHVLVVPIASLDELRVRLAPIERVTITIGSDAPHDVVRGLGPAHARLARLGEMQRPPLDGPVDLR